MSVIAEGDIIVTGNPDLQPEPESQIQFVTNMDLRITGDIAMTMEYAGHILVREQIDFYGSGSMVGQVVCQNVTSVSNEVTANNVERELRADLRRWSGAAGLHGVRLA